MTDRPGAPAHTDPAHPPEQVTKFFASDRWSTPLPTFVHSGYALVEEVRAGQARFVIDVGCGHNLLSGKIANRIGIDLVNPAAELPCDLLDASIQPSSIDVILALGCLDFGAQESIEQHLRRIASWLTATGRIVMRADPGLPTGPGLPFFTWSAPYVDAIGAGLCRDDKIRYNACRSSRSDDELRLVWQYRPAGSATAVVIG